MSVPIIGWQLIAYQKPYLRITILAFHHSDNQIYT